MKRSAVRRLLRDVVTGRVQFALIPIAPIILLPFIIVGFIVVVPLCSSPCWSSASFV